MKGKHPIDELLRSRFEEMEASLPEMAWDRLASDLDRRRRRKVIFWTTSLFAGMSVLLLSVWLLMPCHDESVQNSQSEMKTAHSSDSDMNLSNPLGPKVADKLELGKETEESSARRIILKGKKLSGDSEALNPILAKVHSEDVWDLRARLAASLYSWESSFPLVLSFSEAGILQDKPEWPDTKEAVTWFVGLHANTGLLANNFSMLEGYENFVNKTFFDVLNNSEAGTFQTNYGLDLSLKMRNGWVFSSGLNIAQRQQNYHYRYSITEFPVVDRNLGIISYLPLAPADQIHVDQSSSNRQYFLEVPLYMEANFVKLGKFSAGVRSGFNLGYAFTPDGLLPDETSLIPQDLTEKMRSGFNAAAHLGVTLNYEAGTRVLLTAEPSWMKNMTGLTTKDTYLQSNPNVRGINIRLLYKLNP